MERSIDLFGDALTMPEARVAKLVEYVKKAVVDFDLVDSITLVDGRQVVLELKSNVQRVLPWPTGV